MRFFLCFCVSLSARFVTPSELQGHMQEAGLVPGLAGPGVPGQVAWPSSSPLVGLHYNPVTGRWHSGRHTGINYAFVAHKKPVVEEGGAAD